jgi:7-cyano-7-deazaguanine synthase
MDSTSLLLHLLARGCQVHGVSFDYGQKHIIELERLKANLKYLEFKKLPIQWSLIDLSTLGPLLDSALTSADRSMPQGHYAGENMRETVVPNRNAIFASIAYATALSLAQSRQAPVSLSLGVHSGDHAIYPDCRPEFYSALWNAFEIGNWNSELVTMYLPYLNFDKQTILKDAQQSIGQLGLSFETIFRNTCTSYLPDAQGRSHGFTGSDVERILAFADSGAVDPLEYQHPWDEVVAMAREAQTEFNSHNELVDERMRPK